MKGRAPKSFHAAVGHLFRNLSDPEALKGNPIVARFFRDVDRSTPECETQVVDHIKGLVRKGAERSRELDGAAGHVRQGQRRFSIAIRCFIDGIPIDRVASELKRSPRQCYRDRSVIASRIARYIERTSAGPESLVFGPIDRFSLAIERAALLGELGRYDDAVKVYTDIHRSATNLRVKADALSALMESALGYGDYELAGRAAKAASATLNDAGNLSDNDRLTISYRNAVLESQLARNTNDWTQYKKTFERATLLRNSVQDLSDQTVIELHLKYCDIDFDRKYLQGKFGLATVVTDWADDLLRMLPIRPPKLRVQVERMRGALASQMHVAEHSMSQIIAMRLSTLQAARQCGSPVYVVLAVLDLMSCACTVGDRAAVQRYADGALDATKALKNPKLLEEVYLYIGSCFARCGLIGDALRMLSLSARTLRRDTILWARLRLAQASCYLKLRRYKESFDAAFEAERIVRAAPSDRMLAYCLVLSATAMGSLGRAAEARELAMSAVALAEEHGTRYTLREAYHVAGIITGMRRFHRLAESLVLT